MVSTGWLSIMVFPLLVLLWPGNTVTDARSAPIADVRFPGKFMRQVNRLQSNPLDMPAGPTKMARAWVLGTRCETRSFVTGLAGSEASIVGRICGSRCSLRRDYVGKACIGNGVVLSRSELCLGLSRRSRSRDPGQSSPAAAALLGLSPLHGHSLLQQQR
jgi:hypothetical protein